ncbi:MAG: T9SS type A sorting domain-containing protein [Bacteroidetes bacterium]|nr:MAG: T9SS type A sorting domain-containing protein [Bacteroidota bacterium]
MKKISLLLLTVFLTFQSLGQIVFENSYAFSANFGIVNLTNAGYKYWELVNNEYKIYNLDHSIYKTITLPVQQGSRYFIQQQAPISDALFNVDTLIEVTYGVQDTLNINVYTAYVINENGNVLFSQSSTTIPKILNIGGSYKMLAWVRDTISNTYSSIDVYSLPGSVPCESCGLINGISINSPNSVETYSRIYPNPSSGLITIDYFLTSASVGSIDILTIDGRLIRTFSLDNLSSKLVLNSKDFSKGTYIYVVKDGISATSGKFIIQ